MGRTKSMTQAQYILHAMRHGTWWSGMHFVKILAILCYTKRLSEIRAMGHEIEKRWNHKGYWEYRLVKR